MNDTTQLEYLTLAEAAKTLPVPRCHMTVWRWSRQGVYGVRLRTAQIGRTIVTTRQWLDEFARTLDAARRRSRRPRHRTMAEPQQGTRRRARLPHAAAAAELDAAGL